MSEQLARAMLEGKGLDHTVDNAELIETHISWLVLIGDYAYKLKKPVDLGFLDFSTLDKRRRCCEEEVRLNRRTAPDIYLDVVAISGTEDAPRVGDDTSPFEYAVRMARFDDSAILDKVAEAGELDEAIIHALATAIGEFHSAIGTGDADRRFATPELVRKPSDANFAVLDDLDKAPGDHTLLDRLRDWSNTAFEARRNDFGYRHDHGFIRECHGDLHLANIFYVDGKCTLFDCIDFNEELRWIDVASDVAFTIMDIESFGEPRLAHLLLNEYLQRTGDYGSLAVLPYYLVYRALVRAKVAAIRARQDADHESDFHDDVARYLALANKFIQPTRAFLVLTSGLSGSGKTTVARQLASAMGAIHLRSDVERKRLFDLGIEESSHARGIDIYTPQANTRTFARLERLAFEVLGHGYPVIVDATFIEHDLRQRFERLADKHNVPWAIVECTAAEDVAKERLANRRGDASEAGFAQFQAQRERFEAFDGNERERRFQLDTTGSPPAAAADRIIEFLDKFYSKSP